jgi:Ca2+-binding RTX toxin-like protein
MKNLNGFTASRASRRVRPAVWAAAVVLAVGAAAALAAGQGNAAPPVSPDKPTPPPHGPKFKEPKLKHGVLKVKGTNESDKIVLRLQAGNPGVLELDVGDDGSADFSFDRARVTSISVKAKAGDDLVRIDESAGAFTDAVPTTIDGGDGADTIAGGKGSETLLGGKGNDSIDGNGGNDLAQLGADDDVFVWDPGDGSDTIEGEAGTDTMLFNGANAAETVSVSPNGNRLTFLRSPANIKMDTAGVERIDFDALGGADLITVDDLTGTGVTDVNLDLAATLGGVTGDNATDHLVVNGRDGGDDSIDVSGDAFGVAVAGLSSLVTIEHQEPSDELVVAGLSGSDAILAADLAAQAVTLTLDGGTGDDRISGAKGVETAIGGDGSDFVAGNGGNDVGVLGAGSDVFVWDPGDGSDVVEGQDGTDTMVFNGAGAAEQITLSPNGPRLRLFRNLGNITMDTAGVEQVDVNALGGADLVTVNDLTGTDVTNVNADLAAFGGIAPDDAADHVIVNGTNGADGIVLVGRAGIVNITGLVADVDVTHAGAADDTLTVDSLAGADTVDASGVAAGAIKLEIDGGDDADTLIGSAAGDFVRGGKGADAALLGAGDDTFVWDPGEGSDVVEGQSDLDTMVFNDANIAEQVTLSANGNRLRLFRDIGPVTMDTAGVERVDVNARGGIDLVTVNDLTGTDVTDVNVDLTGTPGGVTGDGAADSVVVKGTDGDDKIAVGGDAAGVSVKGVAATVAILHLEAADKLDVETLGGQDTVDSTGLAAGTLQLFVDGALVA